MDSKGLVADSLFHLIHELHTTVVQAIDTSLSWDQLNSPPINYTLVRPLVERYGNQVAKQTGGAPTASTLLPTRRDNERGHPVAEDVAIRPSSLSGVLFALMANRVQFLTLAASDLSYAPLQSSRASFCELLAMRLLRSFPHPEDEPALAEELVHAWCAFEGAPADVWDTLGEDKDDVLSTRSSALEASPHLAYAIELTPQLAITSKAKHFLSLPLVQHLINEIYLGRLVYSPTSARALIADSYISDRSRARRRPSQSSFSRISVSPPAPVKEEQTGHLREVYAYNPFDAGWLDHQRLRVPKWRMWMEFASFTVLLALFVWTLAAKNSERMNAPEILFIVFSCGFVLEEFAASQEHGWAVYVANAWNAFDMAYIAIFSLFMLLRTVALISRSLGTSDLAFEILSVSACILFPRLAFFLIKDNVIVLALRAMIAQFVSFMGFICVAFSGICFCLWTLGRGTWTLRQIIWLMLQIWFGSSFLGFSSSASFHPIFGPIILISYAALCNVLLITILISILSNTFAEIASNAQTEHLFQRVVKTVEGVKSDTVFCYFPPMNILALVILVPASWVCSPRTLHRINVFAIRLTSFPILIAISVYERRQYWKMQRPVHLKQSGMDIGLLDSFLGLNAENVIASVFEAGPPAGASRSGIMTPPRASAVTATADGGEAIDDGPDDSHLGSTGHMDSPLAKFFGRSGPAGSKRAMPRSATHPAVKDLRSDVEEVRKSQLRMEELLNQMMSGKEK